MSEISTIYNISVIACALFFGGKLCCINRVMEGVSQSVQMSQEKSLMFIRTEAFSEESRSDLHPPADISSSRIYCALNKPKCEINPFMSHSSMVRWASTLTDSAQSPFRGEGRLFLAYDGKNDRLTETSETRANIDITGLYETGNASLILEEELYICTVYLPHLLPQGAVDLEIIVYQLLHVMGHRQESDGNFSQSSRLKLDSVRRTQRAAAALSVIGDAPSIEDSMVMVAVALVLYGIITVAEKDD
uniref:Uncharacterized protein n=1 Tax=Cyprinus carpio carpio TaxID=630221 RepID=A0A8C1B232_CYPCA